MKNHNRLIKIIVIILCFKIPSTLYAQSSALYLDKAIALAQHQSFEYKVAFNRFQSNLWNYRNYKTSFLPTLLLEGTIPNYSRNIARITLPSGEDAFVSQNQAYSNLNLSLKQNIIATGGIVSLGSSLNRIDVFGNNSQTSYSTIPVSLSYMQNMIGYNGFNWSKKIEPLRFEFAQKDLVNSMQQIASQVVTRYFNMISSQTQLILSQQNLANTDTLNSIANNRFKLGTVSQSDLLQLRLKSLSAQQKLREDSIGFTLAKQNFVRYLSMKETNFTLELPTNINYFIISYDNAIRAAKQNSEKIIEFRLKRLTAEQNLARTKAENKLKFNVQANFGLSNTGPSIPSLFYSLVNQQSVSVGFSLPILDWGMSKTQKLRSEADLALVKSEIEQQEMQLEQEIALYVSKWNLQKQNIAIVTEAKETSEKNYELELQRYRSGAISLNDLNSAQSQKDNAINAYVQSMRTYWELYYVIRELTLYDFELDKPINVDIIDVNSD